MFHFNAALRPGLELAPSDLSPFRARSGPLLLVVVSVLCSSLLSLLLLLLLLLLFGPARACEFFPFPHPFRLIAPQTEMAYGRPADYDDAATTTTTTNNNNDNDNSNNKNNETTNTNNDNNNNNDDK